MSEESPTEQGFRMQKSPERDIRGAEVRAPWGCDPGSGRLETCAPACLDTGCGDETSAPRVHSLSVPETLAGRRLDAVAAELWPEFSRNALARAIREGRLLLDNAEARPRDHVTAGQVLRLTCDDTPVIDDQPQAIALDVVFEDEFVLVLNKPAGTVVHPGAGNRDGTLVNALLHYDSALADLPRAGIVHRLDKDTSGLLVVARTSLARQKLMAALAEHRVQREYVAWVLGDVIAGGAIDQPIGRHPVDRKRMAVHRGGKRAVTHYRVEARSGVVTRLAVQLETGRTHQIRVHLTHVGHPLVGDPVYRGVVRSPVRHAGRVGRATLRDRDEGANSERAAAIDAARRFARQALHARRLAFEHPVLGGCLECTATWPDDLVALDAEVSNGRDAGATGGNPATAWRMTSSKKIDA
ncbi:MAG: RluA family pseudouridine synthase [Thioalkalivibrionaceae bacterium]